jgi:hypothetical protein
VDSRYTDTGLRLDQVILKTVGEGSSKRPIKGSAVAGMENLMSKFRVGGKQSMGNINIMKCINANVYSWLWMLVQSRSYSITIVSAPSGLKRKARDERSNNTRQASV